MDDLLLFGLGPLFGFQQIKQMNNRVSLNFLDNLYPYGYSDTSNDAKGVISKIFLGFTGKSDKRKALDEFVTLDLNTPEGMLRGEELKNKYFTNFRHSSLQDIQNSAKARLDANDLYLGRPLTYGTWKVNEEYQSPTAEAAGVPTYTYADENLRRKHLEMAARYGINNGVGIHSVNGDPLAVFNRYSVSTTDKSGLGRWVDKWDFIGDLPGTNTIIIGDTVPPGMGRIKGIYKTTNNSPTNETFIFK